MRISSAVFLLLFLLLSTVQAEITEQEKLQQIQQQLQENKQKLQQTKQQQQEVLGRLVIINTELKKTKATLGMAQRKIVDNEQQIGFLTTELRQTENELGEKEKGLRSRLDEVYKSSGLNYLELLLGSKSMSDFLNRVYFFGKIIKSDAELVKAVRSSAQKVKVKRSLLQDKTEEIKDLAKVFAQKKEEISAQAEEKNKIYQALGERKKEYERQIAELEKSSKEMEALILRKMAAMKGGKVKGSGRIAWPLEGRFTSNFGWRRSPFRGGRSFHTGLDIANAHGSPIRAADAGEVIFSGWWDGYGKAIVISHGRGLSTVYGHMSRLYKQEGDVVAQGQIIGLVGSTGYSTGPHLHFEVRENGKPVNPMRYLK